MKAKEIRDLIDFISSSDLDEVNIETEEFKISVKKNLAGRNPAISQQNYSNELPAAMNTGRPPAESSPKTTAPDNPEDTLLSIKSPMIGTFYRAPNPEAEPFVNVGDIVNKGQTVCVVEAMKLFNEIESDVSGKIVKVLAENSSPIEYDQPLFLVEPL